MGDPWSRTRLVGGQYCWLLHRSAGARRRERDAALLPRAPLRRVVRVGNRCRPLAQIKPLRHSQHIRNKSAVESNFIQTHLLYRLYSLHPSHLFLCCPVPPPPIGRGPVCVTQVPPHERSSPVVICLAVAARENRAFNQPRWTRTPLMIVEARLR